MKIVLITGGAGFIGSHLSRKLAKEGVHVRIYDNMSPQIHGHVLSDCELYNDENIEFIRADVCDLQALSKALNGVSHVVHLASETGTAQSMYEITRYCEVNILGTANLLEAIGTRNRTIERIILTSSRSVYGEGAYHCPDCAENTRIYPSARKINDMERSIFGIKCDRCNGSLVPLATAETDTTSPASIYAATKLMQENMTKVFSDSAGIPSKIFRLQNVFGEGQSLSNPYTGILSNFCLKILNNEPTPIFEDGAETRDFVHVGNVVESIFQGLNTELFDGETINVGTGAPVTIVEISKMLHRALNKEAKYTITGQFRAGDIRNNWADTEKLMKLIPTKNFISLENGLELFAEWILKQQLPVDRLESANEELVNRNLLFKSQPK